MFLCLVFCFFFSVCGIFSVTWPVVVECDSTFLVLTWVWLCCLVTLKSLVQTLVWFNLVRAPPHPSLPHSPGYPSTQIPRSAFRGARLCVSARVTKTFRECFQPTQRSLRRRPPSPVGPQQYVKNVLLLWHTSEHSQPPHRGVSQWWWWYNTLTGDKCICHTYEAD